MGDRRLRGVVRWAALAAAVAVLLIFVVAQRQSVDVSYGRSPSASGGVAEGSAGELSDATVPSVEEMTRMVGSADVVRLPGSVARWDEERVRAAMGGEPMRILVAPPGLDKAEADRVRDVRDADIRIVGTRVSGGPYQALGDSVDDWRAQFGAGDVTNLLITLIAGIREQPSPADVHPVRWRDPTAAEVATVAAQLRRTGLYTAAGATLTEVPARAAAAAFPAGKALYVALPRHSSDEPAPRYGPALTRLFPGTPIVELHGDWIEYHGPQAGEFAEVAAAGFYSQFGDRLSRYAYPQANVLGAYLGRVTDVRYAGLFDRPLPYRPADPVRVALPFLPWLFVACAGVFLALSARSLLRGPGSRRDTGTPARLAGLTALAVEMSALTGSRSEAPLTRGITALTAARSAVDDGLPDAHVRSLLATAEAELDEAARLLPYRGYRPADYLRGELA